MTISSDAPVCRFLALRCCSTRRDDNFDFAGLTGTVVLEIGSIAQLDKVGARVGSGLWVALSLIVVCEGEVASSAVDKEDLLLSGNCMPFVEDDCPSDDEL